MIAILFSLLAVVNVTTPSATYSCDGSTAVFWINFPYLSSFDLKVTSTTPAGVKTVLAQTTDWSVDRSSTASTATLTLTSPATKCSAGSVLKISNDLAYTQPSSFRAQTVYNQALHEQSYDRATMQIQKLATTPASADTTGVLSSADWQKFNSAASVNQLQPSGVLLTDSTAIQTALNAQATTVNLGASATCFNLGTTTVSIPSNRTLNGQGRGAPGAGPTCLVYTGSTCAVVMDSVHDAGLTNLDIQVNSASPTAAGVCYRSSSGVSEFNAVEHVSVQQTNPTRRVVGQVGLWFDDEASGNGVFWNGARDVVLAYWDTAVLIKGGNTQGANDNSIFKVISWGHNTGLRIISAGASGFAGDNDIHGFKCSRSDGTLSTSQTCVVIGDDGSRVFGNYFNGVVADQGAPSACATLGVLSGGNEMHISCESGGTPTDGNTTAFPNAIYDPVHWGVTIVSNVLTGKLGGGAGVAGGAAAVGGGGAGGPSSLLGGAGDGAGVGGNTTVQAGTGGASSGVGGNLNLLSGSAGGGTASPGNVLLSPGTRAGSSNGGNLTLGPSSALGVSGVRTRSSRIIWRNASVSPVDCAGAAITPTVSTLLDGGIFTCSTAQTLTLPTAQGSTGIIQNLPGNGSATPPQVGDIFRFTMVSTAAANFTVAAGTGGTITGAAVTNNTTRDVVCRVTSIVANSETFTCY